MPKQPLQRASEMTRAFLENPDYAALYCQAADEEIGAALRSVREARGLSQQEIAARLGVSCSRVSQIEGTEGTKLSLGVLSRYARAVGCHLDITLRDSHNNNTMGLVFVPACDSADITPPEDAAETTV